MIYTINLRGHLGSQLLQIFLSKELFYSLACCPVTWHVHHGPDPWLLCEKPQVLMSLLPFFQINFQFLFVFYILLSELSTYKIVYSSLGFVRGRLLSSCPRGWFIRSQSSQRTAPVFRNMMMTEDRSARLLQVFWGCHSRRRQLMRWQRDLLAVDATFVAVCMRSSTPWRPPELTQPK